MTSPKYPTETADWAEAEKRKCPYNRRATDRHDIIRVGTNGASPATVGHCRRCGTSVDTILREQPGLDDVQPTVAT